MEITVQNLIVFFCFFLINISFCFVAPCSAADPPSADLDQLELPVLCDGLRRYLQDLPQPIIPAALSAQMVLAAKGEKIRTPAEAGALASQSAGAGAGVRHRRVTGRSVHL